MERVLLYIRTEYGSMDRYLDEIGFDRTRWRRLREALCE